MEHKFKSTLWHGLFDYLQDPCIGSSVFKTLYYRPIQVIDSVRFSPQAPWIIQHNHTSKDPLDHLKIVRASSYSYISHNESARQKI